MKTQKVTVKTDSGWGQALSDLADGRASEAEVAAITAAWREHPDVRRQWHALHLIGDTLRSTELAEPAQGSEALLASLRERIAQEPVPLRPRRLSEWLAPLAVAAGFVAVALLMPSLQTLLQPAAAPSIAQAATEPLQGQTLNGIEPSFAQAAGLHEAMFDPVPQAASGVTSVPASR